MSHKAAAEVTLWKSDTTENGWEVYSNGRLSNFFSWANGDGMPQNTTKDVESGQTLYQVLPTGGTGSAASSQYALPKADGTPSAVLVSHINSMRIRSGFVGNVIGAGFRRALDPGTTVTGYMSLSSVVDSQAQKKYFRNFPDVREAYITIAGSWGSILAGRAAVLFNRGAVEADFLYLHGYGLGFPADLQSGGFPTAGQIGFGILGAGYAAGFVYTSPAVAGLQLSAGIYDPASLTGTNIERTQFPRPEFELTADEPLGQIGKAHFYVNGCYQPNYRQNNTDDRPQILEGLGYGARIELGPVHVGAGGHRGKGLGLAYAGLASDAVYDVNSDLRSTDGYYVMGQLSLAKFDFNIGYGVTRIAMTTADVTTVPGSNYPQFSVIKSQTGVSGAVVLHASRWLHFDVDVMHADSKWDLGERQRINFYNAGTTLLW